MKGEPTLDNLLAVLSTTDFSIDVLAEDNEKLQELLYFCCDDHAENVSVELKNKYSDGGNNERLSTIITNLSKLYPLTREIISYILRDIEQSDYMILQGVDTKGSVLRYLEKLFKDIRGGKLHLTRQVEEYERRIDSLNADRDIYSSELLKVNELIAKRDMLQQEVDHIRRECNPENQNTKIKQLQDELEKLKIQQKDNIRRENELNADIEKITHEIKSDEGKLVNREAKSLLRKLVNQFPSDQEDDR